MVSEANANAKRVLAATLRFCVGLNSSTVIMALTSIMTAYFDHKFSSEAAKDFILRNAEFTHRYPLYMQEDELPSDEELVDLTDKLFKLWASLEVTNSDVATGEYNAVRFLWRKLHGEKAKADWDRMVLDWTNHWNLRWVN